MVEGPQNSIGELIHHGPGFFKGRSRGEKSIID
jgi:hypothetical protein